MRIFLENICIGKQSHLEFVFRTPYSLQEIEFGVKQIVKVCFMNLMYNIDLVGEHIKSCNMQQFYFFPNGQKYAIMI